MQQPSFNIKREKKKHWGYLRRERWEEYLDVTELKWWEAEENYFVRSFVIYTLHQTFLGGPRKEEKDEQGMQHARNILEMCI